MASAVTAGIEAMRLSDASIPELIPPPGLSN